MGDAYCPVSGVTVEVIGQNGTGMTNMVTNVAAVNQANIMPDCDNTFRRNSYCCWEEFEECDQVSVFKAFTIEDPEFAEVVQSMGAVGIRTDDPSRSPDVERAI